MSWPRVKLSSVARLERDGIASDAIQSGTLYLGLEHIEAGGKIIGAATVDAGDLASTKFRFTRNHVLYGKLRPYLGKIATPDFDGICSTDIVPIMPGPRLDRSFLTHFLRQPTMIEFANSRTTGANLPRLSPKALADFEIPLPPLEEQKRIAAILDQADELRRKRQRALDRLNQLGQAIFVEMFGDPAVNPMGWPVGTIRDLVYEAKYGTSAKANTDGVGLPILRMGNLTYDGKIDLSDLKHIELSDDEFEKYTTRPGDILFNRTNSKELVGKTAVVTQEEPLAIAGYLVRARTNKKGNPHYISAYLNSTHGKTTLRNMCKNIVGMANINAQEFQNIGIALPPKKIQDDFGLRIANIELAKVPVANALARTASIFTSLQHRAFRGELTASSLKEAAA